MSQSKPIVLTSENWNVPAIKYMAPKINDRGGKSINMISTQTNRTLHVSSPLLMTWGISDFVDEKGESDGKYSMSLNFPNTEYATQQTNLFLQKLKDFENQILDDAVKNSELWWNEEMSREVAKHTFFPFIKYSKNKETKKVDFSKPPSIRAKVPFYNGKWAVEIYDTKSNLIFPCENPNLTPVDFIPKMSSVACVLQCGGIWIGGKGWGLTWKLIQCVVKPREIISVYGKCQIQLSNEDRETMDKQEIKEDVTYALEDPLEEEPMVKKQPVSTIVEDSDDEQEVAPPAPVPVLVDVPAPPVPVKKVIKKVEAVQPAEPVAVEEQVEAQVEAVAAPPSEAPKKKIIKKVVAKA